MTFDLGPGPVALDTAIFIYFVEENPSYLPMVEKLFEAIDVGALRAITSAVTLLEVLVLPLRADNRRLAAKYERLLTRSRHLDLLDLDRPLVRQAAEIRAATGVSTPDALQLSAALRAQASSFLTNDRRLPAIPGLTIVQLPELQS